MEPTDFMKATEIKLNVDKLKGIYWNPDTGKPKKVLVFTMKGKYLIWFADNLETEPENTFFLEETVFFKK